jgi:hypothetical protein
VWHIERLRGESSVEPTFLQPLRAERRRSNQLEKELRKARAQLSRFAEIKPNEYARLQDAQRQRNEANLRKERLLERLFREAEVGSAAMSGAPSWAPSWRCAAATSSWRRWRAMSTAPRQTLLLLAVAHSCKPRL